MLPWKSSSKMNSMLLLRTAIFSISTSSTYSIMTSRIILCELSFKTNSSTEPKLTSINWPLSPKSHSESIATLTTTELITLSLIALRSVRCSKLCTRNESNDEPSIRSNEWRITTTVDCSSILLSASNSWSISLRTARFISLRTARYISLRMAWIISSRMTRHISLRTAQHITIVYPLAPGSLS